MRKRTLGLLITVASAIVYGLYPPAARLAYVDGANPAFLIVVTSFTRFLFIVLYCLAARISLKLERRFIGSMLCSGFFQALSIFGIIASLQFIPGPVMITLVFTHTLMLLGFLAWRGEINANKTTIGTSICALIGISLVVNLWGTADQVSIIGVALALLGAVATMIRLYMFGNQVRENDPAVVGSYVMGVTSLLSLFLLLVTSPAAPHTISGYCWVALSSLSLAVGTLGMFYAVSIIGSFQFSLMLKLEPIATSLFSYLLAGELLSGSQYIGIAIVLSSLLTYQYHQYREQPHN